MRVLIHRSHERGDALRDYIIARVFIADRVFVDAEMNPFTEEAGSSFDNAALYLLDDEADEDEREDSHRVTFVGDLNQPCNDLSGAFDFVRWWYLHPEATHP